MKFFNIDKGGLLYIEKGTLDTDFKPINFDESYVKMAFERMKKIHWHLTNLKLPHAEAKEGKNKWMCRFCKYYEKCKEVDENGNK